MSASSSTRSWWRMAKPLAVTALWAMMMTKHDAAMGTSRQQFVPGHRGQGEVRQPARNRPEGRDAEALEVVGEARGRSPPPRRRAPWAAAAAGSGRRGADPRPAPTGTAWARCACARRVQDLPQLAERSVANPPRCRAAPQHGDADLKPHAGEESDQHRARQEVGEEAEPEDARQQQQRRREQGDHGDQVHVVLALPGRPCRTGRWRRSRRSPSPPPPPGGARSRRPRTRPAAGTRCRAR